MKTHNALHQLLDYSAQVFSDHTAIEEPGHGTITYKELAILSDRLRDRLCYLGIRPGDRVGIYLQKSIDAVASIFGILKTGATYVPVDPRAPASRNAYILNDCSVKVVVLEQRFEAKFRAEIEQLGAMPQLLILEGTGGSLPLKAALKREDEKNPASATETVLSSPQDLAYILYTSGSTGKPKGVMLSQRNALSFVDWCSEVFQPTERDCTSSHAPLHFDLSILDLYVSIKHGATLILISEEVGKDPARLAPLISERRISIWYSAPSILSLLAQYGNLERYDYSCLRLVLFAGEVFPVKHLRALQSLLPKPRYFNLYGPTETNVCTFYEVPSQIPEDRTIPYPIGKACSHLRTKVINEHGQEVSVGEEGELCVSGSGVMQGYWNLPERSAQTFLEDPSGQRWYKTGDIVVEASDGNYIFIGRRDRMVKRRGYRVELGEIEACLYRHSAVKEAAVVAFPDKEAGIQIKAFLSCRGEKRPSLIELKRFCSENLPLYMVPDLFSWQDSLPKTSTDKIDYQRLKEIA
jgi:amino acid adenylation domain-containing protein